MAKRKGKTPSFEEVNLPSDGLLEALPPAETAPATEPAAEAPPAKQADLQPLAVEGEPLSAAASDAGQSAEPKRESRLLKWLGALSPYTVMLGLALLAITIAVLCLLLEWRRYGFDIRAKSGKGGVSSAAAALTPALSRGERVSDEPAFLANS